MEGYLKNCGKQSVYGWLNPYFTRTCDGNTEYEHYTKLSVTSINQVIGELAIEFYRGDLELYSE